MRVLTLQQRLRLYIAILFVVVFGILIFVLYPTVRSIMSLQTEIDATEAFLEEQYAKALTKRTQTADLDAYVSSTDALAVLTVDPTAELALIREFEEIAATHGISQQLQIRFFSSPDKQVKLPYFEFNFNNSGSFDSHVAYLHDVLSLPYIVAVNSIDVRASNRISSEQIGSATVRFSAKVYVK